MKIEFTEKEISQDDAIRYKYEKLDEALEAIERRAKWIRNELKKLEEEKLELMGFGE